MKATIKTIASEAGVSIATVSKALNDLPDVSTAVKERIREIARKQGYSINVAAKQLASGAFYTVGAILPNLTDPAAAEIYPILSQRLQQNGYLVRLGISDNDLKAEATMALDMLKKGIDLLLIFAATTNTRHIEEAVFGQVPVAYIGGAVAPGAENAVTINEYRGGMLAAKVLEKADKTAVFTWGGTATAQHERVRGYVASMQERGKPVKVYKNADILSESTGYTMARALLEDGGAAGVFATDDRIAAGAVHCFREAGVRVPEDIQVIGYGDAPFADLGLLRLSTVSVPAHEMGICAANLVLDILGQKEDLVRKMTLDPRLTLRQTTLPAGKV